MMLVNDGFQLIDSEITNALDLIDAVHLDINDWRLQSMHSRREPFIDFPIDAIDYELRFHGFDPITEPDTFIIEWLI